MVGEFNTSNVNHEKLQHDLEEENKFYGDILQCNFTDSYNSLPTKVSILYWEDKLVILNIKHTYVWIYVIFASLLFYFGQFLHWVLFGF